jgi:flagellar hook-associated protein 2
MSTSTSPLFNGTSTFSTALQTVITNSVSLASLPMNQLQGDVTTLGTEQTALSTLSTSFSSLQSDVAAIDSAVSSGSQSAASSNTKVATATASSGALPGAYSLEVDNVGSQSTAVSTTTVTDPTTQNISTSTTYTLSANGQQYTIEPPVNSNTLDSLVSAINTTTQGAVQATVVNVGTSESPSYELSLQSNAYSSDDISLDDGLGSGNILNPTTEGSPVQYDLGGQTGLTSDTQTLTISPNLTAAVVGTGTTSITVSQSTGNIASALTSFVTDYNAASTALAAQRGQSGGALAGQGLVDQLSEALQNLTNYTATGPIQSMADLGLTFNQSGVLAFDPTVLSSVSSNNLQGVTDFLGSATGGGFLQAATNTMNSVMDSTSGIIPTEQSGITAQIATDNTKIATDQTNINTLQTNLTNQMDSADALIAEMQQQYSYVTGLFASMTANQTSTS